MKELKKQVNVAEVLFSSFKIIVNTPRISISKDFNKWTNIVMLILFDFKGNPLKINVYSCYNTWISLS